MTNAQNDTPPVVSATTRRSLAFLGFSKYEIDIDGTVWSKWKKTPSALIPCVVKNTNYMKVTLVDADVKKTWLVHTLVLLAFSGKPPSANSEARHLNGVRADNRAQNLRWGTPKENAKDRKSHGRECRGEKHYRAKIDFTIAVCIRQEVASGRSQRAVGAQYGVSATSVADIINYRRWA